MYSVKAVRLAAVLFGAAVLAGVGGCASEPKEVTPQATEALGTMRSQLFTGKSQVQEASNAAKDLIEQPRADLTAQINRLNKAVAALNDTRTEAHSLSEAQRATSNEYFAKWDASLNSMSEGTAEKGRERLAEARASTAKLRQDGADIREHLNPFMGELNEAIKYLSTDTTKAGLDVVRPKLESAVRREPKVRKAIDKGIADIDAIRAGK